MRVRLEEDQELLQAYYLASAHNWPLAVVKRMTLEEFTGWVAFARIEAEDSQKRADDAKEAARNGTL